MRVPERYLCRVPQQPCTPQVTRGAGQGSAGLSQRGYLATIANQHSFNGMALTEARNELGGEADPYIVNARLVTAMTGMLNVLDQPYGTLSLGKTGYIGYKMSIGYNFECDKKIEHCRTQYRTVPYLITPAVQ